MESVFPLSRNERVHSVRFLHKVGTRYSHRDGVYHEQRLAMKDTKQLSPEIRLHIAQTLNLPVRGLVAVIELLDDGGTVPFIARYRKEATGNLDEVQILDIEEKLAYFRELAERRETILASIAEQGKLTDELKARIEATLDKSELEDLYLPYKQSGAPKPPSHARRALSSWRSIYGRSRNPSGRWRALPQAL